MDNITPSWKFKDLFVDYDSFIQLFDEYRPMATTATEDDMRFIYRILFNEFADRSVAFCERCSFYRRFFNSLWNGMEFFLDKMNIIKQIRSLSLPDLMTEYETVANVANNDNRIVESPLTEIIPYITTQSTSRSKGNMLTALQRAITSYQDYEIADFLSRFDNLFLDIYADYMVYYRKGEG